MTKTTLSVALALAVLAFSSTALNAQISTASIQGVVHDSSGAAIPSAAVVLHNVSTNVDTASSTNGTGEYAIVNIVPGAYTLRVSKTGFQTVQQSNLALSVNQTANYDFTLQVGSSGQSINVTAVAPTIESSTAELGTVISTSSVNDLPLNGRNFTELLQLTPGASPINTAQQLGFKAVGVTDFPSFHGARNRANLFLVDGVVDQSSISSNYAVSPIVDDIQEFKVDAHNDQVQFGGVSGGVVNVVTKSGTNAFHGAAWEYLRNSDFDARNPFFTTLNPLHQNQFGVNGGGPVLLPHYNGRNRTFFFASYEGFRNSTPSQTLGRVPTASELQGNLADLGVPIYNPFTTVPDPANPGQYIRDPFANSVVPQSLMDPAMSKLAQGIYPAPTGTGTSNFSRTTPVLTNQNLYNIRGDQQLGDKDSLWFRFSHVTLPTTSVNPIGDASTVTTWHAHTFAASWTHIFGPGTVMQAQFGRSWGTSDAIASVANAPAGVISALSPRFCVRLPR